MDLALVAKMAKYAPLLNKKPDDIESPQVVSILQDLGIATSVTLDQVEAVRGVMRNANVETLGALATRPELMNIVKSVFAPKDGRPVKEGNQITGHVIHQCGHCKMFNQVPFHVEMG